MRKRCERCGGEFGCADGAPGCWCEGVVLSRDTLAELRALADDCLCPDCLRYLGGNSRSAMPAPMPRSTAQC